MEILFEILKIILPSFITGIITFLATKYTYYKNRPLDKLEIAYNRVYYPIYRLITDKNNTDIDSIITKCKNYFDKYIKYIDKSTIRAYDSLCVSNTKIEKQVAYETFISNINDRNSYLRRQLGYLEPNILQLYKYSTKTERLEFRILLECFCIYVCLIIGSVTKNHIQLICVSLFLFFSLIMIGEIICRFFKFLFYKIKK